MRNVVGGPYIARDDGLVASLRNYSLALRPISRTSAPIQNWAPSPPMTTTSWRLDSERGIDAPFFCRSADAVAAF
jgi:hypothetical protein